MPNCRLLTIVFAASVLVCGPLSLAQDQPRPVAPATTRPAAQPPRRPLADPARPNAPDPRVPDSVQLVRDVVYAEIPAAAADKSGGASEKPIELKMDVAFLKQSDVEKMPAIIYIHGGGWSGGTRDAGLRPSVALALGGYFAVTIDYRLSGDAKYPAAVHDCKAAIRFFRANAEKLGIDPDHIGVWGHSAGGHLSALMGTSGNSDVLTGNVGSAPSDISSAVQCVVDFSGPIDLTAGEALVDNGPVAIWLGGSVRTHMDLARQASPTTYVDAKDPPTMIIHGADDNIVNIRQSESFEKALKEAGVAVEFIRVEGAGHMFADPDAYRRAAAWFDKYLGGHAEGAVRELMQGLGGQRPGGAGTTPSAPPKASTSENAPEDAGPKRQDDHPAPN
jgi:acetyl esterase/lipase